MDIERGIEFLQEQQAKFCSDVEEIRQRQEQLQTLLARVVTIQEGFGNAMLSLAEAHRKIDERIDRLVTERIDRHDEAQQQAEERMNALIATLDDLISRKGNA